MQTRRISIFDMMTADDNKSEMKRFTVTYSTKSVAYNRTIVIAKDRASAIKEVSWLGHKVTSAVCCGDA